MLGTGSWAKKLPAELVSGPEDFRRGVLSGWQDGDGCRKSGQIGAVSVSRALALGMFDIAQGLGMKPAIRWQKAKALIPGIKSRRDGYDVTILDNPDNARSCYETDTHVFRRVRGIEEQDYAGWVYNLSVEGDESYVADGLGVHNCTSMATAAAFQYDAMLDGADSGMLSRLFIYWQERAKENDLGKGDTGANGSDAFWAAQHIGVCAEADWPYDPARYNDPAYFDPPAPPDAATADAGHYKLTKSYATPPLSQLTFKQALSNRQTIAFGFSVYESFESPEVAKTGIVPMPGQDESQLGGHEVLLCGFLKDEPNYGLVRNSWGSSWGLGGYMLMPWPYILDQTLSADWTTIVRSLNP